MKKIYVLSERKVYDHNYSKDVYLKGTFSALGNVFKFFNENNIKYDKEKIIQTIKDNKCGSTNQEKNKYSANYFMIEETELNECYL